MFSETLTQLHQAFALQKQHEKCYFKIASDMLASLNGYLRVIFQTSKNYL